MEPAFRHVLLPGSLGFAVEQFQVAGRHVNHAVRAVDARPLEVERQHIAQNQRLGAALEAKGADRPVLDARVALVLVGLAFHVAHDPLALVIVQQIAVHIRLVRGEVR